MLHILIDAIRNSILITGLVIVMMMMIESLNIESKGLFFKGLKKTRVGQVIFGALLGSIPGCMGGFATVSLYTHRMFSFGALIAMMIASSGDEAFIMLAMIPEQSLLIFAVLFVVAIIAGMLTDLVHDKIHDRRCHHSDHSECGAETDCHDGYVVHAHENEEHTDTDKKPEHSRHFGWKRIIMFIGLALFIGALATGQIGHDHGSHAESCTHTHSHHECCTDVHHHTTINLLDEEWMNVIFAGLSLIMLVVLIFGSDHFIEDHLWNHIIKKHLLTIFCWTSGILILVGIGLQFIKLDEWISSNTVLMIILATLIGIIPESGPHMIFVTLYAAGIVPLPVLLASSISQDGHSSLPLIAESRKSFFWAKLINCAVALAVGFIAYAL